MSAFEVLALNTSIPQIQAAQAGDSYVMVVNATTPALRITQTGTGDSILVEDAANPDSSPFVVTSAGDVGIGTASPTFKLQVIGTSQLSLSAAGTQQALQLNNSDTTAGTQAVKLGFSSAGVTKASINAAVYGNDYMTFNVGSDIERARITSTGEFQWKPDGTTQAMTLDASGNLIIGDTSGASTLNLVRGGSDSTEIKLKQTGTGGRDYRILSSGSGYGSAGNLIFYDATASAERARITSGGVLLVGTQTNPLTDACKFVVYGSTAEYAAAIYNSSATNPFGTVIRYSASAPNSTGNQFLDCIDTGATRAQIRSNGGLANYQSNNVDLSDARTKTDINPLGSYWSKIAGLEIVTYKYKDQTHDDLNIGVIAQQVEAVAPEFVDTDGFGDTPEDGVPLKTIYNKDLTFAAIKALQEAMSRIETLEAKIAALEAK